MIECSGYCAPFYGHAIHDGHSRVRLAAVIVPDDRQFEVPRRFFAFSEAVKRVDGAISALFACLPVQDVGGEQALEPRAWDDPEIRVYVIWFVGMPPEQLRALGLNPGLLAADRWYRITGGNEAVAHISPHSLDPEGPDPDRPFGIALLEHLPATTALVAQLRSLVSCESLQDASEADLYGALRERGAARSVDVYNVGQGNCVGIVGGDGLPRAYFDLGMGCFWNRHTVAVPPKLCYAQDPTVVLSHWDCDHWYIARADAEARRRTWITPRPNTPLALKVAERLNAEGKLLIWPDRLDALRTSFGQIRRCRGHTRNDRGLAAVVELDSTPEKQHVLLPGDAKYEYAADAEERFHAVVATHHGSHNFGTRVPVPASDGCGIVYSYGKENTYRHPSPQSESTHFRLGWKSRLDTTSGNVAILGDGQLALPLSCGPHCSILRRQVMALPTG